MSESIGTILGQVSRLLRRTFDERVRVIGVTRPQWQLLNLLSGNEGINQGGLADLLEVEPITAGRMIDRLQDGGLVERKPDPSDRRVWRLFLTADGETLLDDLRPLAKETLELALEGIDDDERAAFVSTLERVRANLTRRAPDESAAHG